MSNISTFLHKECINLEFNASSKHSAIKKIGALLTRTKLVVSKTGIVNELMKREFLDTTAIGNEIAIPHCYSKYVRDILISYAFSQQGIDFDAPDHKKVHFIFCIVVPENKKKEMLKLLVSISQLLRKPNMIRNLKKIKTSDEIFKLLKKNE